MLEFPNEFSPEEMELYTQRLEKLIKQKKKNILVDFSKVEMIHSSGLGLLINNYKLCKSIDSNFGLVHVNPAVLSIIQSARLDKILKIFPTMKDIKSKDLGTPLSDESYGNLDFVYHEIYLNGIKMLISEGIMSEGRVFKNFVDEILKSEQVILDFTNLSFIELNCLDSFNEFCVKTKVYIYGVNEVLEDEFRFFEIKHKFTQAESLKEIIKNL